MFVPETRILVVDDMSTMRKIVIKSLKNFGFKDIQEQADGDVAWSAIQEAKPQIDLVISDWNMPRCSGLDLLKRVRADSRFKSLPFILLTAESEAEQVSQAVVARVDGYIVKPFTAESLQNKMSEVFKKVSGRAA